MSKTEPDLVRRVNFDITIQAGWARPDLDMAALSARAAGALGDEILPSGPYEVSLVLTSDAQIQKLNHQYRQKDSPTNILSFPTVNAPGLLGDIILAYETIAREAAAKGAALEDHAAHLIIHGLLHLRGYDHQEEDAASAMEAIEIAALEKLGIANPYLL